VALACCYCNNKQLQWQQLEAFGSSSYFYTNRSDVGLISVRAILLYGPLPVGAVLLSGAVRPYIRPSVRPSVRWSVPFRRISAKRKRIESSNLEKIFSLTCRWNPYFLTGRSKIHRSFESTTFCALRSSSTERDDDNSCNSVNVGFAQSSHTAKLVIGLSQSVYKCVAACCYDKDITIHVLCDMKLVHREGRISWRDIPQQILSLEFCIIADDQWRLYPRSGWIYWKYLNCWGLGFNPYSCQHNSQH